MNGSFPRLLVATEFPPNASGGGPAVVRQMLKDWPAEKLFWWSCLPDGDQRLGQQVAAHRVAAIPPRLYPHQRWCAQKSWLLDNLWMPWAVRHFQKTLGTFQPEAIWVIPHAWAIPVLAEVLAKAGIGFHVTVQDFMDSNSYIARFGASRCRSWAKQVEELYRDATTRDTTSNPMTADLLAHTGAAAAQMLHAGLELEDFDRLAAKPSSASDSIRIAYAGTIVAEKEFALFAQTLAQIRERLPQPVWLDFFSNHVYHSRRWFDATWMREHGLLAVSELSAALRECTWGFSPMALTDDDPRYNRFSFPTKFITYLAAGLPVVTLGHPESSVMKLAQTYQVGPCLVSGDPDSLSQQLLEALSDRYAKSRYRSAILRCARNEFDARRMRRTLYENFKHCAAFTGSAAHG